MEIQTGTKLYASRVRTEVESNLAEFVKSDQHLVAVAGGMGKSIGLPAGGAVTVTPGNKLQAIPTASDKLTAEQRLAIEKAAVTFGSATLPMLKKYVPGLTGAIDGIDVVFATKIAFDAWADPERQSIVKPVIKTTRAFFELVDVAQAAIPALKQIPYLDAVGVLVKVGDSVTQLWTDVSKITRTSPIK
ncbi:MAG: hypothetical protein ABW250_11490 [Pyrinomonadaceae bacterium]